MHQLPQFAPNNTSARHLFTGRSDDLDKAIQFITSDTCVAVYGEHRSGKTMFLEALNAIINGDIDHYSADLVDRRLRAQIPLLKSRVAGRVAIMVTLQGTRSGPEFAHRLALQAKDVGLSAYAPQLDPLLRQLQISAHATGRRLVIILDEMEVLATYTDQGAVAELLSDRSTYRDVIFVHAGSYLWRQRVDTPASKFTHVEPLYLKSPNIDDLRQFLLAPLASPTLAGDVLRFTGGKALYTQYVGQELLADPNDTSFERLERHAGLSKQVEANIFTERALDEDSHKMLQALAYHRNAELPWLANHLQMNEIELRNRAENLELFGTITRDGHKYRLAGEFIEWYGKRHFDDPTRDEYTKPPRGLKARLVTPVAWSACIIALVITSVLYFYTNPSDRLDEIPFASGVVTLHMPASVEDSETGKVTVGVTNKQAEAIATIRVRLTSPSMRFESNGTNTLDFININQGETRYHNVDYTVEGSGSGEIQAFASIDNQTPAAVVIDRRLFPFKKFSVYVSAVLTLVLAFVPSTLRKPLLSAVRQLIPGGKTSPE